MIKNKQFEEKKMNLRLFPKKPKFDCQKLKRGAQAAEQLKLKPYL